MTLLNNATNNHGIAFALSVGNQRQLLMVLGQPGTGKSTFIREHQMELQGYVHISADRIARALGEKLSEESGQEVTMDQVYVDHKKEIFKAFKAEVKAAAARGENILVERTGSTRRKRQSVVNWVRDSAPDDFEYQTAAIVMAQPDEQTHIRRLIARAIEEGRFMAINNIIIDRLDPISPNEFDRIVYRGTDHAASLCHEYRKLSAEGATVGTWVERAQQETAEFIEAYKSR